MVIFQPRVLIKKGSYKKSVYLGYWDNIDHFTLEALQELVQRPSDITRCWDANWERNVVDLTNFPLPKRLERCTAIWAVLALFVLIGLCLNVIVNQVGIKSWTIQFLLNFLKGKLCELNDICKTLWNYTSICWLLSYCGVFVSSGGWLEWWWEWGGGGRVGWGGSAETML